MSAPETTLGSWFGQPIDTLPRETLLEIIAHLQRRLDDERAMVRALRELRPRPAEMADSQLMRPVAVGADGQVFWRWP